MGVIMEPSRAYNGEDKQCQVLLHVVRTTLLHRMLSYTYTVQDE